MSPVLADPRGAVPTRRLLATVVALLLVGAPASAAADAEQPTPASSVLSGTVRLEDGTPLSGAEIQVMYLDDPLAERVSTDATGAWSFRGRPGRYRLDVRHPLGIETWFPDVPWMWSPDRSPTVTVAADATRDGLEFVVPRRPRFDAVDAYGYPQHGVEGLAPDGVIGTIPFDPTPRRSAVIGPRAKVDPAVNSSPVPVADQTDLIAFTGTAAGQVTHIENTGDDALWIHDAHVEGPDAALFACRTINGRPCSGTALAPGWTSSITTMLDATQYRDVYRATLVIGTNDGGERRVALNVRNLLPRGVRIEDVPNAVGPFLGYLPPAVTQALLARKAPTADVITAAARTVARRVRVSRSTVTATFPSAGTARVVVDRRTTGTSRRRWSAVRDVRLRAARAGTVRRRVATLRPGRYRLRVRASLRGGRERTATIVRTIRAR